MEGTTERDEYYDYTRRVKAKRRNMELNNVISNGQASDFIKLNPDNNCADGSVSYFWRAHTVTVLVVMILVLVYIALFEQPSDDSVFNAKRGLVACFSVFIAFGVTQARDGPFTRPHPVFWRFTLCCSIIYELLMIFLLFQTLDDARKWMGFFDSSLGRELPEIDYGGNCKIYDPDNQTDPFHNFKTKMDTFVVAHLIGWWAKTIILRDIWLSNVISVLFEVYEYTLEHQLPNFHECWWDHWIVDALLCNGLGIYLGVKTCQYLEMKEYNWRNLWNIPSYSGKLKRAAEQFTPYSWESFHWKATASLKRWLGVMGIIIMFSLAELNVFYLKFVLWINPEHWLIIARLVLYGFWGAVAIREVYQYMDDPTYKKFGQQAWMLAAIIVTETLICLKFGWETIILVPPTDVIIFWFIVSVLWLVHTIWMFFPPIVRSWKERNSHPTTKTKVK